MFYVQLPKIKLMKPVKDGLLIFLKEILSFPKTNSFIHRKVREARYFMNEAYDDIPKV